MNDIKMEINMKAILRWVKPMVKGFMHGPMEKFMMGNGVMESKKAMVFGKAFLEIPILANGRTQKLMGMVYTNGKMEIDMKVTGSTVLNMVKALIYLQMGILIQENMIMESRMDSASISGQMVHAMLVTSVMV